jgi:XisH protein
VRDALEKEGWLITDDPLAISTNGADLQIDLGAERDIIGAQKNNERIAVEIKSLKIHTYNYDFYQALGQFLMYRLALINAGIERELFLAIPQIPFNSLEKIELYRMAWKEFRVNFLIFDDQKKTIVKWIKY